MTETFLHGDYRNELKAWIQVNCLHLVSRLVKAQSAQFRLMEDLSMELVRRRKHGIGQYWVEEEIRTCGKFGWIEDHKQSKKSRLVPCFCNHRAFHIPCAIRYRNGQGLELKNQYMEVVKSLNLWGVYSWNFTLPESIRRWIDTHLDSSKPFLQDLRRAVSKTIKTALKAVGRSRNVQPGFSIMYHPFSSGDPFRQSSHFHVIALPILVNLKTGEIIRFDQRISDVLIKGLFKRFLDEVLESWNLQSLIEDRYVVHLRYIDSSYAPAIDHAFKYDNRSQAEDILKRVKRVSDDLQEFVCVLNDKKNQEFIPVLKTREELLDAFERALNPVIQIRMSYGFMRTIEKYSDVLKIKPDDQDSDDNWVRRCKIEFLRMSRSVFDQACGKVKNVIEILWREAGTNNNFARASPAEIVGERVCMSGRKLFKAESK